MASRAWRCRFSLRLHLRKEFFLTAQPFHRRLATQLRRTVVPRAVPRAICLVRSASFGWGTVFTAICGNLYFTTNGRSHTHTHTRLTALCLGLPGWAGTRKEKPVWILLKQDTVSGSGSRWAICKSAPRSSHITTPARHHSKHWRQLAHNSIK